MDQRTLCPSAGGKGTACFPVRWKISIFGLFGTNYTFVDFSKDGQMARIFCGQGEKACQASLPSERVSLQNIWDRQTFVIRPDDHIAWRAPLDPQADVDVEDVLLVVAYQRFSRDKIGNQPGADEKSVRLKETLLLLSAMWIRQK